MLHMQAHNKCSNVCNTIHASTLQSAAMCMLCAAVFVTALDDTGALCRSK